MEDEPDVVVYSYSPRLYAALQADLKANDLASLIRWRDELAEIAACISDVDQRLPSLGLTLPRLVELVQHAWEAEDAAQSHRWHADFRPSEALAPAMRAAVVNLYLRGLPPERIACALTVPPTWVAHAIAQAGLDDKDRAVVQAHLAGKTQSEIAKDTGTPRTTVERILERRLGESPRRSSFQETAQRRRTVRRLKAEGHTVSQICKLLDLPKHTVLYDLRGGNRGPAE